MSDGSLRHGRSSVPACPPRRPGWRRSGAGRWAVSSPCCTPAATRRSASTLEAPPGPGYSQVEFEHYDMPWPADAIVACASLHHVADLGAAARPGRGGAGAGRSAGDRGVGARAIRRGHRAMVLRPAARARKRSRLAAASVRGMARFRPELGRLLPFLGGGRRACIQARTSCASSGRGSAPGPSPTGLTSSPS